MDPDPAKDPTRYSAIVFDKPNFKGSCSFLAQSVPNLHDKIEGYYPTPIGNGTLSSLIITKTITGSVYNVNMGVVTLYTAPDCPKPTSSAANEVKSCDVTAFGQQNIYSGCSWFNSGDAVMSISISGPLGVALSTTEMGVAGGSCSYWDINSIGDGICISNLPTEVYDIWRGTKPMSVIVIPVDKK